MSTRVHELAKELGIQSKDLLDRIKDWGLPVKASIFAGLDSATVDAIRERHKSGAESASTSASAPVAAPASSPAAATASAAPSAAAPPSAPSSSPDRAKPVAVSQPSIPSETPAIRQPASAPPNSSASHAQPTEPTSTEQAATRAPQPEAAAPVESARPTAPRSSAPAVEIQAPQPAPAAPPQAPTAASSPARPANPTPGQPAAGPRPGAPVAGGPSPQSRPPGGGDGFQNAPRPSGGGGLNAPPRPAGSGPLSRHTHRGAPGGGPPPQQDRPQPGPRPQQGPPPGPRAEQPRPPVASSSPSSPPGPLQRGDYISPTGTRPPLGRPQNMPSQPPSQPRRPEGDMDRDRDRIPRDRDNLGSRRPLPSVAQPSTPPPGPRRPEPRPPVGGGEKTQRPEMKFTREQLLQMRQSGELGGAGGPPGPQVPGRPGAPPPRPGSPMSQAPRPGGRFPSAPAGGNVRPPMPPPGGAPPLQRRPPGAPVGGPIAPPPPVVTEEDDDRKGKRPGSATDRAGRRVKRDARADARRVVSSPLPASALISDDDDSASKRGPRRGGKGVRPNAGPQRKTHAEIEPPLTIRTLSEAMGVKASDLIRKMMTNFNQLITINANIDEEMAQMLALEFGVELEIVHERTAEDDMLESWETDDEADALERVERPPVVTILGHVDHGKTSLLDRIRSTNVVAGESGGITQHIGAYQVEHQGKLITFVDTPGHEAFTEMRARGANVTDIVILVVAADDGVMPQTVEAISHAKAADVPIIIALNKIDLPNVNINKIYGELSQQGLVPEEYGGDTPVIKTSATQGIGIADLLEMIGIVAELRCELKANPGRHATGTCLEALISEGRGAVARVIVQDGTLHVGDVMVCGDGYGRVRALFDDKGRSIEQAGPSTPVEVSGLDAVPTAGEKFGVIDDLARAREIAEARRDRSRGNNLVERQAITLENLFDKMAEKKVKSLNVILKTDVQGSLEALAKELEKLVNPEVPIRVLHKGVGGITESDVLLADASQAIVIGFRVAPEDRAVSLAEEKKIDIRRYDIIYQVTDEIKKAVEGMLIPEIKEVHLGRAVVRQLFKISKVGTVAGCFVTQGLIERSAKARVLRDGREIYKSSIEALKRFKDDVKEVRENFECGIKLVNFDDLKADDVIEAYRVDVIRRTL